MDTSSLDSTPVTLLLPDVDGSVDWDVEMWTQAAKASALNITATVALALSAVGLMRNLVGRSDGLSPSRLSRIRARWGLVGSRDIGRCRPGPHTSVESRLECGLGFVAENDADVLRLDGHTYSVKQCINIRHFTVHGNMHPLRPITLHPNFVPALTDRIADGLNRFWRDLAVDTEARTALAKAQLAPLFVNARPVFIGDVYKLMAGHEPGTACASEARRPSPSVHRLNRTLIDFGSAPISTNEPPLMEGPREPRGNSDGRSDTCRAAERRIA